MKKMKMLKINILIVFVLAVLFIGFRSVDARQKIPEVVIADFSGNPLNTKTLLKGDKPVVLTFWSTTCKPCLEELQAFKENFADWNKAFPFTLVAVSVDDSRFSAKVKAVVSTRQWPATVLLDKNQDFKRALNVNVIPQLFLFDRKGDLILSHTGYSPGNEHEVYEALKNLYH